MLCVVDMEKRRARKGLRRQASLRLGHARTNREGHPPGAPAGSSRPRRPHVAPAPPQRGPPPATPDVVATKRTARTNRASSSACSRGVSARRTARRSCFSSLRRHAKATRQTQPGQPGEVTGGHRGSGVTQGTPHTATAGSASEVADGHRVGRRRAMTELNGRKERRVRHSHQQAKENHAATTRTPKHPPRARSQQTSRG